MPIRSPNRRQFMAVMGAAALVKTAPILANTTVEPFDLVIKGGRIIDPASNIDGLFDLAIANGQIALIASEIAPGAAQVLDASGRLVVPGLIDIHTHATVEPDSPALILADGVTGWIETGWQGADTVSQGIEAVQAAPQTAGILLNIGRKGVLVGAGETRDLTLADVSAARDAIASHSAVVVGVKARLSRTITGDHDYEVLRRAQEVARPFGIPVMIHIGDTFTPLGELLELLKPGDIVTHMYAPPPHTIVDANGRIIPEAIAAREQGVMFDWGNGTREHVLWEIAEQAIQQGFLPDTISTDWTSAGYKQGVVGMPTVMSNVLSLGVPLEQVVAMATIKAANTFPLFKGRGTLQPGAPADVAVMDLREGNFEFVDTSGNKRPGTQKLFTAATVLAGKVVSQSG